MDYPLIFPPSKDALPRDISATITRVWMEEPVWTCGAPSAVIAHLGLEDETAKEVSESSKKEHVFFFNLQKKNQLKSLQCN